MMSPLFHCCFRISLCSSIIKAEVQNSMPSNSTTYHISSLQTPPNPWSILLPSMEDLASGSLSHTWTLLMTQFYWFQCLCDDMSNILSSQFSDRVLSYKSLSSVFPQLLTKRIVCLCHTLLGDLWSWIPSCSVKSLMPKQSQQIRVFQCSFTE